MAGQQRYSVPRIAELSGLLAAEPWREFAACVNHRTFAATAWDDVATESGREDQAARERRVEAAKNVCRTECQVRQECARDTRLGPGLDAGIRAGVDLREKDARKKLAAIAALRKAS